MKRYATKNGVFVYKQLQMSTNSFINQLKTYSNLKLQYMTDNNCFQGYDVLRRIEVREKIVLGSTRRQRPQFILIREAFILIAFLLLYTLSLSIETDTTYNVRTKLDK